tara:strand:- start:11 stop:592 length:582 start_codon:yes stop_codon:yes gene_type:complete
MANLKKLRDINKDGKVNFKDTWLGEKLTTKGKIKGPNLKESMAGARRGEAPKAKEKEFVSKYKPDAPGLIKRKVISPDPVVVEKIVKDLKDVIEKNPIKKVSKENLRETKKSNSSTAAPEMYRPSEARLKQFNLKGSGGSNAAQMARYTKAEWEKMSPRERMQKGLPVRPIDMATDQNKFKKAAAPKRDPKRG